MLASGEQPVDHQATAVVQPVSATPLPLVAAPPVAAEPPPPPSPAEIREAQAEQAAEAWALVQRVLYHPDAPGRAESLYRRLCTAGDTRARAQWRRHTIRVLGRCNRSPVTREIDPITLTREAAETIFRGSGAAPWDCAPYAFP